VIWKVRSPVRRSTFIE